MIQLQVFNSVSADFTQTVNLGGMMIQLRLIWNIRAQFWFLRLTDANEKQVGCIKLVPNYLLVRQHKALFPMVGDLLLVREDRFVDEFPTFENLGTAFNLYYLDADEATTWEDLNGLG